MISWIVASHHRPTLEGVFLASMKEMPSEDELIIIEDAPSITIAYDEGQLKATKPVMCFIHHDVSVLDLPALREALVHAATCNGDLVGVIGSRTPVIPWWIGSLLGSVQDSRLGVLDYGDGGECAVVDGLLLASRGLLPWDLDLPGWHGYDHDIANETRRWHGTVWCISGGRQLVRHVSDSPFRLEDIDGWDKGAEWLNKKWAP